MPRIFISYRRADSGPDTGRLYDRLAGEFGQDSVFRDVYSIDAGRDFLHVIDESLRACDVCLVVIGSRWMEPAATGLPRLHEPTDPVRIEIETALTLGVGIVPVLIAPAALPAESALPESLRPLLRRQKVDLSDSRWEYDVGRLIDSLGGAGPPIGLRARVARAVVVADVFALVLLALQWTLPLTPWAAVMAWIADHVVAIGLVLAALVALAFFVVRGGRERPTQAVLRALRRLTALCERPAVQYGLFGSGAVLLLAIWATPAGVTIREVTGPADDGFCSRHFVDSRMQPDQKQQCPGDRNVGACGAVAFSCSYYEIRLFTGVFRASRLKASVAIAGTREAGGGEAAVSWADAALERGDTPWNFSWGAGGRELDVVSPPSGVPRTVVILATRQYDLDAKPAAVEIRVVVTSSASAVPFHISQEFSVEE